MARRMFEKAGLIPGLQAIPKASEEGAAHGQEVAAEKPKAKTAPGTMMGFLTAQSNAVQEADGLRARVKFLEERAPVQKIDPKLIRPSKWANRHESTFLSEDFASLKAEIADCGGNVQPIKVRPVPVLNGSTPEDACAYELIFGHRRHRACLDLGLPVLATIEEATDVSLFEQMERENRGRKNLSAWEQGMMYRKALDEGLYSSLRRLAEGLGVDVSLVSKSMSLARLPDAVVTAFATPLDIQFRWAAPLAEAMQKDPEGTLERAALLAASGETRNATAVFAKLIGRQEDAALGTSSINLKVSKAGKRAGKLEVDTKGRLLVQLDAGVVSPDRYKVLVKLIEDFLKT